VSKLKKYIWTK